MKFKKILEISRSSKAALVFLLVFFGASQMAAAATTQVSTSITRIAQADENRLGGCAIEIDKSPAGLSADCPVAGTRGWFTVDCDGDHGSKAAAQGRMNAAYAAMLTNRLAQVFVNDAKITNGLCWASEIRIYR